MIASSRISKLQFTIYRYYTKVNRLPNTASSFHQYRFKIPKTNKSIKVPWLIGERRLRPHFESVFSDCVVCPSTLRLSYPSLSIPSASPIQHSISSEEALSTYFSISTQDAFLRSHMICSFVRGSLVSNWMKCGLHANEHASFSLLNTNTRAAIKKSDVRAKSAAIRLCRVRKSFKVLTYRQCE